VFSESRLEGMDESSLSELARIVSESNKPTCQTILSSTERRERICGDL
jgi:hypothetical protein